MLRHMHLIQSNEQRQTLHRTHRNFSFLQIVSSYNIRDALMIPTLQFSEVHNNLELVGTFVFFLFLVMTLPACTISASF